MKRVLLRLVAPVAVVGAMVVGASSALASDPVAAPTVSTITTLYTDTVYPWVAPVIGVMIVLFGVFVGIAWLMRGTKKAT